MKVETLELKYLSPYLPYDLYFMRLEQDTEVAGTLSNPYMAYLGTYTEVQTQLNAVTLNYLLHGDYKDPKLILRPLSDITKEIIDDKNNRFVFINFI